MADQTHNIQGTDEDKQEVKLVFKKKSSEEKIVLIEPPKPPPKGWEGMTQASINKGDVKQPWPFHPEDTKATPPVKKCPPFPKDDGVITFSVRGADQVVNVYCYPEKPASNGPPKTPKEPAYGKIRIVGFGLKRERNVKISKDDQNKLLTWLDETLS
jgi:hypothetical protein